MRVTEKGLNVAVLLMAVVGLILCTAGKTVIGETVYQIANMLLVTLILLASSTRATLFGPRWEACCLWSMTVVCLGAFAYRAVV